VKTVPHASGNLISVSRSGELAVIDEQGSERERYKIPYGASIMVKDGVRIKGGQIVTTWDPHTHPIITEVTGKIKFVDMIEGITVRRQTDEITGLTNTVVTDPKQRGIGGRELRPMVKLVDEKGEDIILTGSNVPAHYFLSTNAIVNLEDGAQVGVGDVI